MKYKWTRNGMQPDIEGTWVTSNKFHYTDIKTYEDACSALGITPYFDNACDTADERAYKKLKRIVRAINGGWTPDFSNANQFKYYPWLSVLSSGLGFSSAYCTYAHTYSSVGSRLCFESSEKCEYVVKQFENLYRDLLL